MVFWLHFHHSSSQIETKLVLKPNGLSKWQITRLDQSWDKNQTKTNRSKIVLFVYLSSVYVFFYKNCKWFLLRNKSHLLEIRRKGLQFYNTELLIRLNCSNLGSVLDRFFGLMSGLKPKLGLWTRSDPFFKSPTDNVKIWQWFPLSMSLV